MHSLRLGVTTGHRSLLVRWPGVRPVVRFIKCERVRLDGGTRNEPAPCPPRILDRQIFGPRTRPGMTEGNLHLCSYMGVLLSRERSESSVLVRGGLGWSKPPESPGHRGYLSLCAPQTRPPTSPARSLRHSRRTDWSRPRAAVRVHPSTRPAMRCTAVAGVTVAVRWRSGGSSIAFVAIFKVCLECVQRRRPVVAQPLR